VKSVKKFFESRSVKLLLTFCLVTAMLVCTAFAAEGDPATIDTGAITTAFTSGFNSMVTNSISMISAMVPIALTLCGVIFLVKKAMGWFKSMAK